MQPLADSLRELQRSVPRVDGVDFPSILQKVHATYLRKALGLGAHENDASTDDIHAIRRLALYLEAETLLETPSQNQELQNAIYVAATIFEYIGQLEGLEHQDQIDSRELAGRLASGDLSSYMRALILYSLGRHESNSGVIGRRLLDVLEHQLTREANPIPTLEDAAALGLRVIVAFLSRDLTAAIHLGNDLGQVIDRFRSSWSNHNMQPEDVRFLAVWLEIAEAIIIAAAGFSESSDEIIDTSRARLRESETRAITLRQSFAGWASNSLLLAINEMQERAVYRVLREKTLPPGYPSLLTNSGTTEFWSSQLSVIQSGFLDDDNSYVINLPTGSGKSLLAEMVILQSLTSHPSGWGVYLVPTRALVHQVEDDLRRRLPLFGVTVRTIIAGLEPVGILGDEVIEMSSPKTITILTPEKLDIYFRNQPDVFSECRVVVVDEAHKIGDAHRGALMDSLLTRIRLRVPATRMILLSAVMTNVLEIATWLNNPTGGVASSWRPTRQLKGLVVRQVIERRLREPSKRVKSAPRDVVRYRGGVVLADKASDLHDLNRIEITIPDLFEAQESYPYSLRGNQRQGPSSTEHAALVSSRLSRLPGVILVFLYRKDSAESCAKKISELLTSDFRIDFTAANQLSDHLSFILGSSHDLTNLVLNGVAYHHSGLPKPARRAIEEALKIGTIRILCATAGLQEGLNTPATTVIVAGTARRSNAEPGSADSRISVSDFANIAGRAGRAGRDTEGQVILLPNRLDYVQSVQEQGREYLFPTEDAFYVRSALAAIESEIMNEAKHELDGSLPDRTQAALLALVAAGLASEDELNRFFESTLANRQTGTPARELAAAARSYLDRKTEELTEERMELYSRTALPITDCELLEAGVKEALDGGFDISQGLSEAGTISASRIAPLLHAVLSVDRLRPQAFRNQDSTDIAFALANWMNGLEYTELAVSSFFGGSLERVVSFVTAAGRELSWGLGSAFLMLDFLVGDSLHPEFGLLPMYVEFGVNNSTAAYLSLLGVSERFSANMLARAYDSIHGEAIGAFQLFRDVEHWARELTIEQVEEIVGSGSIQARVLIEDLGLVSSGITSSTRPRRNLLIELTPEFAGHASSLVGELCGFRRSGDRLDEIQVVGRLTHDVWGTLLGPDRLEETIGDNPESALGIGLRPGRSTRTLIARAWRMQGQ